MNPHDLLSICGSSFLWVFILLAILAMVMRAITALFPEKESGVDEALLAAVTTAVQTAYPGTIVTKVEEIK